MGFYLPSILVTLTAVSCGQSVQFGGITTPAAQRSQASAEGKKEEVLSLSTFGYGLTVADGAPVVAQGLVSALPKVFGDDKQTALTGADLAAWSAAVHISGTEAPALAPVEAVQVDLSKVSGMVTIQADFKEVAGSRKGMALASVFVDGDKPVVNLLRLENSPDGKASKIYWSAVDNYRISRPHAALIACRTRVADFAPKTFQDIENLPEGCAIVMKGDELFAQPATITVGQVTIGATKVDPSTVHFGLYTEDVIGLTTFDWISEPGQSQAQLVLKTTPTAIGYTSKRSASLGVSLETLRDGKVTTIESQPTEWSKYRVTVGSNTANSSGTIAAFSPAVGVTLGGADGVYSFTVQAEEIASETKSNKRDVLYVLDTINPLVSGIQISVPGGVLSPTAIVNVTWSATDANRVTSQTVSMMQTGATQFTPVATLPGAQNSFSFTWGDRPAKGFVIQISAVDPAGNVGIGTSTQWTPQVFNAALLTSSVDCFFCHMKVDGDLGGINFSSQTHAETGSYFQVTDKVFGTNTVPALLARTAVNGAVSNYDNKPLVMFPKSGQWPALSAAVLKPRMNGTLRLGNIMVIRNYEGNLVLDGSKAGEPIQLNGEVYINGDLIIKGSYKGVGTIYANNIYIVDDLLATKSPFPFDADPAKAQQQAIQAIANKTDGLYLGALNQVLIGNYTTKMGDSCGPGGKGVTCINSNPFGWITQVDFEKLGRKATLMKDVNGVEHRVAGTHFQPDSTDPRAQMEVNRVDAFIYAQNNLAWYVYANILLNGGFMAPYSVVIGTIPYHITRNSGNAGVNWAVNPRNGMPVKENVIRYDYRLRVGGAGFETIKSYFDQN